MNAPPRTLYVSGSCDECTCDIAVSVVVPFRNATEWLPDLLLALAAQDTALVWELILSDNGSSDQYLDVVRFHAHAFHSVRVVDSSDAPGPAHARNRGAAASRGALLLFCDADDIPSPYWLQQMHRTQRPHALLAGKLDYAKLNSWEARRWRVPLQADAAPTFHGHPYVVSANMGCPASLFERLGGFASHYTTAAGEDVELPLRAAGMEVEVVFVPAAVIHYRLRPSGREALRQAKAYGAASAGLFLRNRDILDVPTFYDDCFAYVGMLIDVLRAARAGTGARQPLWILRYRASQTRHLIRRREYWQMRTTFVEEDDRPLAVWRTIAKKARERLTGRAPRHTDAEGPRGETPWSLLSFIREQLSPADQRLLAAGLLSDSGITLEVMRNGRTYFLNPAMDPIVGSVMEDGGYGQDELERVTRTILDERLSDARDVVVNVGANIGTTAVELAARGLHVVAIEPVARAADLLLRNVEANGSSDRVTIVRAAVTNVAGPIEMVVGDNLSISEVRGGHTIEELASPGDDAVRIEIVDGAPLSAMLARIDVDVDRVLAVWSDTEGSESAVIETGAELWAAGVPLWVEVRPAALADHTTLADFCNLVADHFTRFSPAAELGSVPARPIDAFRTFVDDVGIGRWDFDNVLLIP